MMNFLSTLLCALLIGCGQNESAKKPHGDNGMNGTGQTTGGEISASSHRDDDVRDSTAHAERLSRVSDTILGHFKGKELDKLARFVHPIWGVRFSPYGYVDTTSDVWIDGDSLRALAQRGEPILWGLYDASGDSIVTSLSGYVDLFIYDHDFIVLERSINQALSGPTTTLDNRYEIYPDHDFVSFRFPGSDPDVDGMDWSGLNLIYRSEGGRLYLVGVIHEQWTI
jgi:hypothetical protein